MWPWCEVSCLSKIHHNCDQKDLNEFPPSTGPRLCSHTLHTTGGAMYRVRFVVLERFGTTTYIFLSMSNSHVKRIIRARKIIVSFRQGDLRKFRTSNDWRRLCLNVVLSAKKNTRFTSKNENRPLAQRSYNSPDGFARARHVVNFGRIPVKCALPATYWNIKNPHYAVDKSITCGLFIFVFLQTEQFNGLNDDHVGRLRVGYVGRAL